MALKLNQMGFDTNKLYVLLGGLKGWADAGYGLEAAQ